MSKLKLCFFVLFMFLIYNQVIAEIGVHIPESDQNWTISYNDPVRLAIDVINRTPVYWNPIGYNTILASVNIGYNAVQYGGAYILLESPKFVTDLVTGGFYKLGASVSYDFLIEIIKQSVRTPKIVCRSIASTMMKEGLEDYKEAYKIARKYKSENYLTREDAIKFLEYRWGIFKMSNANTLQAEARNEDYSIENKIAEIAINEILEKFEDEYQSYLGINNKLPIMLATRFITDMYNIINAWELGLANFKPYLEFTENIKKINDLMISEKERFQSLENLPKIEFNAYDYFPLEVGNSWTYIYTDGTELSQNYLEYCNKYTFSIVEKITQEIKFGTSTMQADIFVFQSDCCALRNLGELYNENTFNSIIKLNNELYLGNFSDNHIVLLSCILSSKKKIFLLNQVSRIEKIPFQYLDYKELNKNHISEENIKVSVGDDFKGNHIIYSKGIGPIRLISGEMSYGSGYILLKETLK